MYMPFTYTVLVLNPEENDKQEKMKNNKNSKNPNIQYLIYPLKKAVSGDTIS